MMGYTLIYMLAIGTAVAFGAIDDPAQITVGIIADTAIPVTNRMPDLNMTYNVSVVWRFVNYREIFRVFGAVRQLDSSPEIDFIVLTDYAPSLWIPSNVLEVRNKSLIKLHKGATKVTQELLYNITKQYINESMVPALGSSTVPACKERINASSITSSTVLMGDTVTTAPQEIVARLVRLQKWTVVHVFYDSLTERETQMFVDMLSTYGVAFTLYNVDTIQDLHETLVKVYDVSVAMKPEINFAILCRFECLLKVFHAANKFDHLNKKNQTLMTIFSRWLAIVYNYSTFVAAVLQSLANELSNVAVVVVPEFSSTPTDMPAKLAKLSVTVVPEFKSIPKCCYTGSSVTVVMVPEFNSIPTDRITAFLQAIIRLSSSSIPEAADWKSYLTDRMKTEILSWNPLSTCRGYIIKTLLWTKSGRDFSDVGHADLDTSLQLFSELFPNIKYGYSQRLFTITTIPYPPFVINASQNGTRKFEGVCMDLLHELSRILNFTYKLVDPPDNKWGSPERVENGTYIFNGMVGQLQRHEVDISAAPLAIIPAREQVVDFSYPIYHEYTTVVLKRPDPNVYKWRTLVDPFKVNVLLSIGLALLVVMVLVFIIEKYNAYYTMPEHAAMRRTYGGLHHLHDSFWYIYGALLCQGGVHLPDSFAGRTLVSAWWIFCIVIVGTYCGNLIAFLTVSKNVTPFNTLEEMAAMKGEFKWGTLGGTNWEFVFTTSNLPDFRKIGDAMIEFNESDPGIFHLSTNYHINRVKDGGYAWIGDKTTIELAMSKECDLITVKQEFLPMKYGFAFQQNSPHTAIFSDQVMKSQEAGLFEIWRRKWWPKKNFCFAGNVPQATPISLSDVQSAHYLCAIGFVLGAMAFLAEVLTFRFRRSRGVGGRADLGTSGVKLAHMRHMPTESASETL